MKYYKQFGALVIVGLMILPNVAAASWWNPFSWFRKTAPATVVRTETSSASTTTATKPATKSAAQTSPTPKVAPKSLPPVQAPNNMNVKVTIDSNGDGNPDNVIYNTDGILERSEWDAKTGATYGDNLTIYSELGWPNRVRSSVPLTGSIESLPGQSIIRVIPDMQGAPEFKLIISGFPANTDLHVYTEGYRVHNVIRTNVKGEMNFTLPPARGYQYIILAKEA